MEMKKLPLIICFLSLAFASYSQITYEQGYYIDNEGQTVECLIKNNDWRNNPSEFKYKLSENDEPITITINDVQEFGIHNRSKYKRYSVKIDRSSEAINELSTDRNPIFKKEQLFLKVLIEGKATLYFYEDNSLRRYFFKINNGDVEQLIFKSYQTKQSKIGINNTFRQQLWNHLKCEDITLEHIQDIDYNKHDLVDFFEKYHECNNSEFIKIKKKRKRDLFNLTIRPGVRNSSLSIYNNSNGREGDFGTQTGFIIGLEAEFIMPFNKNKWAIIIEPTYQYFKSEKESYPSSYIADYKSIEFPIGLRYYFFLSKKSKIFINGSLVIDIPINSEIDVEPGTYYKIDTRPNFAFGLGYNYGKRYSLEMRYATRRDILHNYLFWHSDYRSFSFIFGYTIF